MCGFAGFTGQTFDNGVVINDMMDRIIHRGPDSSGVYNEGNVCLGFRRLSIIGLEDGGQPIYNEDRSVVIVFNGEIYNYKELKAELLAQGHKFYTNADTEVIVHLYEECGVKLLDRLRGMFAFVIYDKNRDELFAARDFFGIKPFYYSEVDGGLLFGSEIKSFLAHPAFKKEVNEEALESYLTFQYSVLPETFFKGVYKLMPSHYMVYGSSGLRTERYYQPAFYPDNSLDMELASQNIDIAVQDSITMHKVSDVEVGSFLSSGVDSSYVAACFNGDKTFTVGFDYDKYNETEYAKALSQKVGIDNYNKIITTEEYWEAIPKVQYHMDEPLADPSAIALYFVSQLASGHVKVALSGEGADEFFGGYNIYKEPIDLGVLTGLPLVVRRFLGKVAGLIPFSFKGKNFFIRGSKTVEERFIGNANMFSVKEREKLLKNPARANMPGDITKTLYGEAAEMDDITKMQYIDLHLWLVGDILLKADKMSMAHSLEVRVPYLDKEVFAAASVLPTRLKVTKEGTKLAFRKAANKYLPAEVAEKKKLGFPVPIRVWLREEKYYSKVKAAFESPAAQRYFNTDALRGLLDSHRAGKRDNSRKIWTVYMFLVWYEEFFEEIKK